MHASSGFVESKIASRLDKEPVRALAITSGDDAKFLARSNLFGMLKESVKAEGFRRGAYTGLSASILRQMTYSTARFGSYPQFIALIRRGEDKPGFSTRLLASSAAGAFGGIVGNPADIVLVRMTADTIKPPDQRYAYRNCFDGVYRISVDEGLRAFFRGWAPNCARAVLMNASQISTYSTFKDAILGSQSLQMKDGLFVHTISSTLAGTVATMCCSPFDVLKSRIMNAKGSETIFQVLKDSFKNDGPVWMARGFVPAWLRLTPQTVITFAVLEQIRKFYTGSY